MFSGSIEGVGPVQVHRLHLADVTLPQGTPLSGQTCPVHAYLVLHPHGPVLFDTGVSVHPVIDQMYRPVRYAL
ncbi:MAG TPA: hypothetical protein VFT91_07320, partial [Dehalococcoidia bacterium]|nr:hypothetical protein [Dehalococcoidia bacterium]